MSERYPGPVKRFPAKDFYSIAPFALIVAAESWTLVTPVDVESIFAAPDNLMGIGMYYLLLLSAMLFTMAFSALAFLFADQHRRVLAWVIGFAAGSAMMLMVNDYRITRAVNQQPGVHCVPAFVFLLGERENGH